jgi:hypothetical protein
MLFLDTVSVFVPNKFVEVLVTSVSLWVAKLVIAYPVCVIGTSHINKNTIEIIKIAGLINGDCSLKCGMKYFIT